MEINNCPNCGGRIEFSPNDKALKCVNCMTLYPVQYTTNQLKHPIDWIPDNSKVDKWASVNRSYKCEVCGAKVTYNRYDIACNCQYCNASSLTQLKDLPGLKPEKIIPFKIDKIQAKQEFKSRILKRKFLPNQFKKNLPNVQMGATYISCFSFDADVFAEYSGREKHTRTKRDSSGRTETETYYTYFSGKINKSYTNMLVEASDKISQRDINSILPYDFSHYTDYNDDFIKGYNVGYYNQDVTQAEVVAKDEMLKDIEMQIRNRYMSIDSLTVKPTYSNIKYNYTLLPTYFVNFDYKNKSYFNIMNGQNGKMSGQVPRSGLKISLLVLLILAIIGLPVLFIMLGL